MHTDNTLSINNDKLPYTIRLDSSEFLSLPERRELLSLLKNNYPHWGIANIFDDYPAYNTLYILRFYNGKTLVASRQILIVNDINLAPQWAKEMAAALKIQHFAIGSRAIVHPDFREQGLGTQLVQYLNNKICLKNNIKTILGYSSSLQAIKLYLCLGAKLWEKDLATFLSMSKILTTPHKKYHPRTDKRFRYVYQLQDIN